MTVLENVETDKNVIIVIIVINVDYQHRRSHVVVGARNLARNDTPLSSINSLSLEIVSSLFEFGKRCTYTRDCFANPARRRACCIVRARPRANTHTGERASALFAETYRDKSSSIIRDETSRRGRRASDGGLRRVGKGREARTPTLTVHCQKRL